MRHLIFNQFDFNLQYAKKSVEDLTQEQMVTRPSRGLENHPAFTLGHLVTGRAMMIDNLGGKSSVPKGWKELFERNGPGDPRLPSEEKGIYPSKAELILELEKQHKELKEIILNTDDAKFNTITEWRFRKYMPSLLDLTIFMCINHEAMHLGQLAAWRRAMKLDSALAKL